MGRASCSDGGGGGRKYVGARDAAEPPTVGDAVEPLMVGDEWKEARTAEGRIYYYNRRTRVPRWTLPPTATYVPDPTGPSGYRIFSVETPSRSSSSSGGGGKER
ncbi:unnamed protein product, partial [Laminaria digitata]